MSFYNELFEADIPTIWEQVQHTDAKSVEAVLSKDNWTIDDLPLLISDAAGSFLDTMRVAAGRITIEKFKKKIELYAPLYVSNFCVNSCLYCGFNVRHKIPRKTLTPGQVEEEAYWLYGQGIRNLLIVSGEHPKEVPLSYFEELGSRLSPLFPRLNLEIYPLDQMAYERLVKSGFNGVTLYQETYQRRLYPRFHKGPKSDFSHRLETLERAANAGMRHLGLGSLLGLGQPQMEIWALGQHARYLMNQYPGILPALSFPRIREAEGQYKPEFLIADDLLEQAVYSFRMCLPNAHLVLSTRESGDFRDRMLGAGITRISAGSITSPGGYRDQPTGNGQENSLKQFSISDNRSIKEMAEVIEQRGFHPVW